MADGRSAKRMWRGAEVPSVRGNGLTRKAERGKESWQGTARTARAEVRAVNPTTQPAARAARSCPLPPGHLHERPGKRGRPRRHGLLSGCDSRKRQQSRQRGRRAQTPAAPGNSIRYSLSVVGSRKDSLRAHLDAGNRYTVSKMARGAGPFGSRSDHKPAQPQGEKFRAPNVQRGHGRCRKTDDRYTCSTSPSRATI